MMEMELYKSWTSFKLEDLDLKEELAAVKGDVDEIHDRFYRELEFGTGGLRGVIGAGTNRMNIYTVRKATQGFADYINESSEKPSVAISYDSRIKSDLFAKEAARVLAANDIKVYLFKELMPTPCVSFAVRELNCDAGIMVTASHNPAKYNGYKAYGSDGCQITLEQADRVLELVGKVDIFAGVKLIDFQGAIEEGLIEYITDDVVNKYYEKVLEQSINTELIAKANLNLVYTPLNGAGNKPVREILKRVGIDNIAVVKEQENPDGHFPTCPYPNPEITEALDLGLKLARKNSADLLLATDPDSDRVGIAVPDKNGELVLVSGNEVGVLLLDYICAQRIKKGTMPANPVAISTIVSTSLTKKIAEKYSVDCKLVLTGFKFIGEQILMLENEGKEGNFIFGFEESYGYLSGTYCRDKDAVVASMLICEMAAYLKSNGLSILDKLSEIYAEFGYYNHTQKSFTCEGSAGMEQMREIMTNLRANPPKTIGGFDVVNVSDYATSQSTDCASGNIQAIDLPKSDVLGYELKGGATVFLRPSGTEPKIKAYYSTIGETVEIAQNIEKTLSDDFTKILGF